MPNEGVWIQPDAGQPTRQAAKAHGSLRKKIDYIAANTHRVAVLITAQASCSGQSRRPRAPAWRRGSRRRLGVRVGTRICRESFLRAAQPRRRKWLGPRCVAAVIARRAAECRTVLEFVNDHDIPETRLSHRLLVQSKSSLTPAPLLPDTEQVNCFSRSDSRISSGH